MAAERWHRRRVRLDVHNSVRIFTVFSVNDPLTSRCRPGILSSIWGLNNLGRNFGYISYAAFVGTTAFSYLYASIASRHVTPGQPACDGVKCWQSTFGIGIGTSPLACFASFVLWRRWEARV